MQQWLAIACGGAAGALSRWLLTGGIHRWVGREFPWGTLAVNVLGSFLLGLLAVVAIERLALGPTLRVGLLVGFLGAFTTFSTFALDAVELGRAGLSWRAGLYVVASVGSCVLAVLAGIQVARQFAA